MDERTRAVSRSRGSISRLILMVAASFGYAAFGGPNDFGRMVYVSQVKAKTVSVGTCDAARWTDVSKQIDSTSVTLSDGTIYQWHKLVDGAARRHLRPDFSDLESRNYVIARQVSQAIGNGRYLVNNSKACLQGSETGGLYEGAIQPIVCVSVGSFDYTTVFGAPRTVNLIEPIKHEPVTRDRLIKSIRAGNKFTVLEEKSVICLKCNGLRFVRANPGSIRKVQCSQCRGTGKCTEQIPFEVVE